MLSRVVGRWARVDLLIADELGYVSLPASGAELLFQILAQRSEAGSVIVTTNCRQSSTNTARAAASDWDPVAINRRNSRFICREYPERPGRVTAPHIRRALQRPLEPKRSLRPGTTGL
jgi:IstB-like ATP binding protein